MTAIENEVIETSDISSIPAAPAAGNPAHDTPTLPKNWEQNKFVLQLAKEKLASTQRKTPFGRDYRGQFRLIVSCKVHSPEDWIKPIRLTPDEAAVIEQQLRDGLRPHNLRVRTTKLSCDGHGQQEQTWELTVEVC